MSVARKRILVVAQNAPLRETRVMLLAAAGYYSHICFVGR
jgi:hypothetical protein